MANPITKYKNRNQIKKFNRELSSFDKTFSDYESLNIELYNYYDPEHADQFERVNDRWLAGRSKIFEREFLDLSPVEAAAAGFSREEIVMHGASSGHPWCKERGLSAKIAAKFEEPLRRLADKNPMWQKLADSVSKTANGGRLPLTAESTVMLKLTCDKKYYNDLRNASLTAEEKADITKNYETATQNISTLANRDGVNLAMADRIMTSKIRQQARIDPDVRIMYPDYRTNNHMFAAEPAKPKTVEQIMDDYKQKMIAFDANCKHPADYKRNHKRPEYKELKEIALNTAKADNPEAFDEIKYMFDRANIKVVNARLVKTGQPLIDVPPTYIVAHPTLEPSEEKESTSDNIDDFDIDGAKKAVEDAVSADDIKHLNLTEIEAMHEKVLSMFNQIEGLRGQLLSGNSETIVTEQSKSQTLSTDDLIAKIDEYAESFKTPEERGAEIASLESEIKSNERLSDLARNYIANNLSDVVPETHDLYKTADELNAMSSDEIVEHATKAHDSLISELPQMETETFIEASHNHAVDTLIDLQEFESEEAKTSAREAYEEKSLEELFTEIEHKDPDMLDTHQNNIANKAAKDVGLDEGWDFSELNKSNENENAVEQPNKSKSAAYFEKVHQKAPAGSALKRDAREIDNSVVRGSVNSTKHQVDAQKRNLRNAMFNRTIQNCKQIKDGLFPEDNSSNHQSSDIWERISNSISGVGRPKFIDVVTALGQVNGQTKIAMGALEDAKSAQKEAERLAGFTYSASQKYDKLRDGEKVPPAQQSNADLVEKTDNTSRQNPLVTENELKQANPEGDKILSEVLGNTSDNADNRKSEVLADNNTENIVNIANQENTEKAISTEPVAPEITDAQNSVDLDGNGIDDRIERGVDAANRVNAEIPPEFAIPDEITPPILAIPETTETNRYVSDETDSLYIPDDTAVENNDYQAG